MSTKIEQMKAKLQEYINNTSVEDLKRDAKKIEVRQHLINSLVEPNEEDIKWAKDQIAMRSEKGI